MTNNDIKTPTIPNDINDDNNYKQKSKLQIQLQKLPAEIRNITAGGLAGMTAKTFVAPIDRIKLLYQVTDNTTFRLRNIPIVVRTIIQKEGLTALWKGNSVTLLRVFPYAGLQFMSFDKCKGYIIARNHNKNHLSPLESLFAGSIAGAVSVTCTYPLDLVRAQMAVLMKMKRSHNPGLKSIFISNFKDRVCVLFWLVGLIMSFLILLCELFLGYTWFIPRGNSIIIGYSALFGSSFCY